MQALIVANCATQTYAESLGRLFPDWEIKGVAIDRAEQWLNDHSRPDFEAYLGICDVYIGEPLDDRPQVARAVNPAADKVLIPGLFFRGLHPDICVIPDFHGPLNLHAMNTQCSLIAVAARSMGLGIAETAALFREDIYQALGFFDLYHTEKARLLTIFRGVGIDLTEEFAGWEERGQYFHACHHPHAFVLVDILRRALLGRYLDRDQFVASAPLALEQTDYLARAEVWPVYPEIAARLGFRGSLSWRQAQQSGKGPVLLDEFLELTFRALDGMPDAWRRISFVEQAAAVLRYQKGTASGGVAAAAFDVDQAMASPAFAGLQQREQGFVAAALAAPSNPRPWFEAATALRTAGKLQALDALIDYAPEPIFFDEGVISIWASVPRILRDWPEAMRRAELMIERWPDASKGYCHAIYPLPHVRGYPEARRLIGEWMVRFPNDGSIVGPAAEAAMDAEDWPEAARLLRELDGILPQGLDTGYLRRLVITLRRQGNDAEAAAALRDALRRFPDHPHLRDLS